MTKATTNHGRYLGAHCSIAGGVYTAIERGTAIGASAIQLFTKNSNQWKASPLKKEDVERFLNDLAGSDIEMAFAHAAYLINLSTVEASVYSMSLESIKDEIDRAELLGLKYVIVHPGSHKGAGELAGLLQLTETVRHLIEYSSDKKVELVLETTAGQGDNLGYDFEHFAEVFDRLEWPGSVGLCVDTAHIFQAGYNIKDEYENVMTELDEVVGLDYIRVFHINDSKGECGSRVDRHEHLGKGKIGIEAFKKLINDSRFTNVPMILETPKSKSLKEDIVNLNLLRSLIKV